MVKAHTNFLNTIHRANSFIDQFENGRHGQLKHNDDLLRMAIVLSVSAMDAYFTNKFCDILIPFLKNKKPSSELIEILKKAGLNTETALDLIAMDRPYRRIRTLVESYFEQYTTQRAEVIDNLWG